MANPWVVAFKIIPWTKVLAVAPSIVLGARELWNSVSKKNPQAGSPASEPQADGGSSLEARLRGLEGQVVQLREDAVSSSELIKSLAEQNAELVEAMDILRIRTRVLLWVCGLLLLAAVVLFYLIFSR